MKKLLCSILGFAAAVCCLNLAGCSESETDNSVNQYNAVIYSQCKDWIYDDFLEDNKVKAFYANPDYVEGVSAWGEADYYYEDGPTELTFTISDTEMLNSIFRDGTIDVDLETQIVYLDIVADTNIEDYVLSKICLGDDIVSIYYGYHHKDGAVGGIVKPYQRCIAVVMDDPGTDNVEFIYELL